MEKFIGACVVVGASAVAGCAIKEVKKRIKAKKTKKLDQRVDVVYAEAVIL